MQAPSSTSSSKAPVLTRGHALKAITGILCALLSFELVVGMLFSLPPDAREPSGSLQRYFSYGYSIESKLNRSVGRPEQIPTDIVRAGWIPTELYPPPENWDSATQRITIYGMSFTNRVASALRELMPGHAVLTRAGPGAPINHSYTMFKEDPWRSEADVTVIGVLSSSLAYTQTISGISYSFESPSPFTYPKYEFVDNRLLATQPTIKSRDHFVEAYRDRSEDWSEFHEQLIRHDAFYDRFAFEHSILDHSALARIIRRAWVSGQSDSTRATIYNPKSGYDLSNPHLAAVPHLLSDMQRECLKNNQQLIVILLHARGEPGHLDEWLRDDLKAQGITVISTHELFDATDPMNFLGDGHYQAELDTRIAETLREKLSERPKRESATP